MPAAPQALQHPVLSGRAHDGRAVPPHLTRPEHRHCLPGTRNNDFQLNQTKFDAGCVFMGTSKKVKKVISS